MILSSDNLAEPQKLFKEGQSKLVTTVSRPLGDKTPFHRNDTKPKLEFVAVGPAKLDAVDFSDIVPGEALLRPSSTRKSIRGRRSSAGGTTLNLNDFKTPFTKGNHWDVSDLDIPADVAEADGEVEAVEQNDYDEVEYMPPTAVGSFSLCIVSFIDYLYNVFCLLSDQNALTSLHSRCQTIRLLVLLSGR